MRTFIKENILFLTMSVLLLLYTILRAIYVPLVHDEATTFFYYIESANFLPFLAHWDANNHILNSALSSLSYHVFGQHEWVLRLPSVLFLLLYLFFVFKISQLLKNSFLRVMFVIALLGSHYMIEFFSLSRGYGMSMALLLGAIYYAYLFMSSEQMRYFVYSTILMILACLANLTLFNTFLLLNLYFILFIFIRMPQVLKFGRFWLIVAIITFFTVLFLIYGLELKNRGLLYYGGLSGFWDMSVNTLLLYLTGEYIMSGIVLILLCLVLVYLWIKQILPLKPISRFIDSYFLFPYLLFGNVVITLVLGYVFNTNFPEDRTGLYFYPLFVIALFVTLDRASLVRLKYTALVFVYFPLHFLFSINFSHHSFWFMERMPETFYQKMASVSQDSLPSTLGGYFSDEAVWAFNRPKYHLNTNVQWSDFQTNIADYAIYRHARNQVIPPMYDTLLYDPISKKTLLQRHTFLNKYHLFNVDSIHMPKNFSDEYFNFYQEDSISHLYHKNLYVLFDFDLITEASYFPSFLVISASNRQGQDLIYERIQLHWYFHPQDKHVRLAMYSPKIPDEATKLTLYLWNIEKKPFEIQHGKVSIFELSEETPQ